MLHIYQQALENIFSVTYREISAFLKGRNCNM